MAVLCEDYREEYVPDVTVARRHKEPTGLTRVCKSFPESCPWTGAGRMGVCLAAEEKTQTSAIRWSTEGSGVTGSWGVSGIRLGDETQGEREATLQRVFIAEQRAPYFIFKALGAP